MHNNHSIYLRKATVADSEKLQQAFADSKDLHVPWSYPPENYQDYIQSPYLYLLCLMHSDEILGSFNLSGVMRGYFQSAYLGYQAFVPHNNKGYMSRGLQLLLQEAFTVLKLHRLEANIQPGNHASIALVKGAGFQLEGFSPHYLRVGGGEWQDHERWAIINRDWQGEN
ncbi:MAG TPA: GNAT family N-acetyltransferase [Cellvibrio sp.]|nr:GNAT family N-acetyltransferase [Cellvibrio sp.]